MTKLPKSIKTLSIHLSSCNPHYYTILFIMKKIIQKVCATFIAASFPAICIYVTSSIFGFFIELPIFFMPITFFLLGGLIGYLSTNSECKDFTSQSEQVKYRNMAVYLLIWILIFTLTIILCIKNVTILSAYEHLDIQILMAMKNYTPWLKTSMPSLYTECGYEVSCLHYVRPPRLALLIILIISGFMIEVGANLILRIMRQKNLNFNVVMKPKMRIWCNILIGPLTLSFIFIAFAVCR